MAHLSNTQKKSRNGFIALLVGILLIAAATAYVLFEGITAKSAFLANQKLATALGEAFSKRPMSVSQDDLAKAKYLEISYDSTNKQYNMAVGFDDFMTEYDKQQAEQAAKTDEEKADASEAAQAEATANQEKLSKLIKSVTFAGDEKSVFTDLKYFTSLKVASLSSIPSVDADALAAFSSVETIMLSSIPVEDSSVFSTYTNLTKGYFNSNGITDVSAFGKLDLDKIEELDFTGNTISDWTPLLAISDKVTVANYYSIEQDENGQYQYVPTVQNLTQYIEEQAKQAQEDAAKADEGTEATDGTETTDGAENADTTDASADETAPVTDGETAASDEN